MNPLIKHIFTKKETYQKNITFSQKDFINEFLIFLSVTYNTELNLIDITNINIKNFDHLSDIKINISFKRSRCSKFYIFPISLYEHCYFVLYIKKLNINIIVDSSGSSASKKHTKILKYLFGNKIGHYIKSFELQKKEHKISNYFYDEVDGYCVFWSLLIIEHLLMFYKKSLNDIITNLLDIENSRELIRKYHTYSTEKVYNNRTIYS